MLFVAANGWCDGIESTTTLRLGAPNDPEIVRDAKRIALVLIGFAAFLVRLSRG